MRGLVGLLITVLIVVLGYWYFASRTAIERRAGHSRRSDFDGRRAKRFAFDCAGGANLLGGAQFVCITRRAVFQRCARRAKKSGRAGYTYSAETSSDNFTVTAHCDATATPGCSGLRCGSIDASPSSPINSSRNIHSPFELDISCTSRRAFSRNIFERGSVSMVASGRSQPGSLNDGERGCVQTVHREEKQNA